MSAMLFYINLNNSKLEFIKKRGIWFTQHCHLTPFTQILAFLLPLLQRWKNKAPSLLHVQHFCAEQQGTATSQTHFVKRCKCLLRFVFSSSRWRQSGLWRLCWTDGSQDARWDCRHDWCQGAEGCLQRGLHYSPLVGISFGTNKVQWMCRMVFAINRWWWWLLQWSHLTFSL